MDPALQPALITALALSPHCSAEGPDRRKPHPPWPRVRSNPVLAPRGRRFGRGDEFVRFGGIDELLESLGDRRLRADERNQLHLLERLCLANIPTAVKHRRGGAHRARTTMDRLSTTLITMVSRRPRGQSSDTVVRRRDPVQEHQSTLRA